VEVDAISEKFLRDFRGWLKGKVVWLHGELSEAFRGCPVSSYGKRTVFLP
jgi:hypothetical protein